MSEPKPLTEEEIAAWRPQYAAAPGWRNAVPRLLATLDARDARIAELETVEADLLHRIADKAESWVSKRIRELEAEIERWRSTAGDLAKEIAELKAAEVRNPELERVALSMGYAQGLKAAVEVAEKCGPDALQALRDAAFVAEGLFQQREQEYREKRGET